MFKPIGKRLLIEAIEEKESATGIILATKQTEKPIKGKVIAISDEISSIKVGEVVIYSKYAGVEVELEDKPYIILQENDVVGVM